MKVHLQFPFKKSGLTYYTSMQEHSPEGISYTDESKSELVKTQKGFKVFNLAKKIVRATTASMKMTIPNLHQSKRGEKEDVDLIHGAHCMIKTTKPWVCDVEGAWQFWISGKYTDKGKLAVAKYLMQPNCKKILAWTNEATDRIKEEFKDNQKIVDKVITLYPGVPVPHHTPILQRRQSYKENKRKKKLLFVGRYFYHKGGDIALEVMKTITKLNPDVEATIISDTPKEIIKENKDNKQITFLPLMPQEKLFKDIYPTHDIFIYPGTHDSLGFCLLEAMSFALPIVTMDGMARKEIVESFYEGYVTPRPTDEDLKNNYLEGVIGVLTSFTNELLKNDSVCLEMGKNARAKIIDKFSIEKRNEQLKQIYEEAVK